MAEERIAIVGFDGLFPGGDTLEAFGQLVAAGRDAIREPPPGRWLLDMETVYDPRPAQPDRVHSRRAGFLDAIPLDPTGFELPSSLLDALDPSWRLILHVGRSAWKQAATQRLDRRRVGVILGHIALPTDSVSALARHWLDPVLRPLCPNAPPTPSVHELNRYVAGLPAGLLARALGLGHGAYCLDAACASSLYAIRLAMDELRAGRADAMLAGGLSRPDSLYTQMGFSQLRAVSPSGRCAPFDAKADGLVVGEGAGVFVLKRLSDAQRDGDHIAAVLVAVGLSNDIEGNLLAPASEGQLRAMRAAYAQAGWQPTDVDLIECHATGTPVGDRTEYQSLRTLWGDTGWRAGQCVIGSAKSNVGHLLTAAGSAGLAKVVLALRDGRLPPSAHFEQPAPGIDLAASPFRVLRSAEPWPRREPRTPRRAAVSAFGFGGINAHLLLEEWIAPPQAEVSRTTRPPLSASAIPIAVIGLDARLGPWNSLQAVQERVLGAGTTHAPTAKKHAWGLPEAQSILGYPIDHVTIEPETFRTPPNELRELLPQQLLSLTSAAAALSDGRYPLAPAEESEPLRQRTAVLLGVALDLNTTNFHLRWWALKYGDLDAAHRVHPPLTADRTMGALASVAASRVARAFGFGGPCFTVSCEGSSAARAVELAVRWLQRGDIDAALVGGIDFAGDPRTTLPSGSSFSPNGIARPFDPSADGTVFGEGAAWLLLKRLPDAQNNGDRVYAVIRGVGSATGGGLEAAGPDATSRVTAMRRAWGEAGEEPSTAHLLIDSGSGVVAEDDSEAHALAEWLGQPDPESRPVLSSAVADVGFAGAASAAVSLVKACLSLYQQVLPPLRHSTLLHPKLQGRVRALRAPQFWLHDSALDVPRRAGVTASGVDGTSIHIVLEECVVTRQTDGANRRQPLGEWPEGVFIVDADDPRGLLAGLDRLESLARLHSGSIQGLAKRWWRERRPDPSRTRAVALVARQSAELLEQLAGLRDALRQRPDQSLPTEPIPAPSGSFRDRLFYSPRPLASLGQLAFVLPGLGHHFPGMGRDIACHWPQWLRRQQQENSVLRQQYVPHLIWDDPHDAIPIAPRDAILAQTALGTLWADALRQLGVEPDAVIGHSLGESVGLFAMRVWTDRDEMNRRMRTSSLFVRDLAGPCDAVRAAWQLPADQPVDWVMGVVNEPAQRVRDVLSGESRAYLLVINTPSECVIGGDRAAVDRCVTRLQTTFWPLPTVSIAHCEVVRQVETAYRHLHLLPTTPPPTTRFYSGAWARSYTLTRDSAADAILAQALTTIDYPRLIETAYRDGVRLFLELGPGGSCTRAIRAILGDRPHWTRAVCLPRQDGVSALLRTLASLVVERVPVDLSPFYGEDIGPVGVVDAPVSPRAITVPCGVEALAAAPKPQRPLPEAPVEAAQEPLARVMPPSPPPTQRPPVPAVPAPSPAVNSPPPHRADPVVSAHVLAACQEAGHATVLSSVAAAQTAIGTAHAAFLQHQKTATQVLATQMTFLTQLARQWADQPNGSASAAAPFMDTALCREFAVGSLARVLGPTFAEVDTFPTRVRLPDDPLMLVDRILTVEGEARSLSSGRVVTEHDVHSQRWYLDNGVMPTCVTVEAGQADLFLSGYLGIDFVTRGLACYRLLDAVVTFHRGLPRPGETIQYDIHIDRFFRQGETHLFRFRFEGHVNGEPLLSMRDGVAGFFTAAELAAGKGVVHTELDRRLQPGRQPADWRDLLPPNRERYSAEQLDRMRAGDLGGCFGTAFAALPLVDPDRLPGGLMRLVHRITDLDPIGGRFGLGRVVGEADIHPDDWFLTCHFVDDPVMPGTLMFECCLHTLRVMLMRWGWLGERSEVAWEPVPGVASRLKCRGQVIATTRVVTYEVSVKERGYRPEPYVIADALMRADGKPIVEITDMSLRLTGTTRERLEALWDRPKSRPAPRYDRDRILAFAVGKPSEAFGEPYRVFDAQRVIARLPGPPYQFLDRITAVSGEPFRMVAGPTCQAEYDVPPDAWYLASERQPRMPFAVLLEVALQPCGWLAAYVGSALTSPHDLSFRNLGGSAVLHRPVTPELGTLTTSVTLTKVASSGGMIIQHFDFHVASAGRPVYEGTTYFGFFTQAALAQQIGIREAILYQPSDRERQRHQPLSLRDEWPFPDAMLRMVSTIDTWIPDGGSRGLGFIEGSKPVDPKEWFFQAHFYQDPVWPGSLGLEGFLQLLKQVAAQKWGTSRATLWRPMISPTTHSWVYRGQVLPTDRLVTMQADVTAVDPQRRIVQANGFLSVDGRVIYQMTDFSVQMEE